MLFVITGCKTNERQEQTPVTYVIGESITSNICMVATNAALPDTWTPMMVYSPERDMNIYTYVRKRQ